MYVVDSSAARFEAAFAISIENRKWSLKKWRVSDHGWPVRVMAEIIFSVEVCQATELTSPDSTQGRRHVGHSGALGRVSPLNKRSNCQRGVATLIVWRYCRGLVANFVRNAWLNFLSSP